MQNVTCSRLGCDPVVEVDIEEKFGFKDVNIGVLRLAKDVEFSSNYTKLKLSTN